MLGLLIHIHTQLQMLLVLTGSGDHSREGSGSDGGAEQSPVVFSDVPLEMVRLVLQSLDPVSLAVAACVSRCGWGGGMTYRGQDRKLEQAAAGLKEKVMCCWLGH
jgi:hypothetical protein